MTFQKKVPLEVLLQAGELCRTCLLQLQFGFYDAIGMGQIGIEAVAQRCSVKRSAFKNFEKFTGQQLCQGLFYNKIAGLKPSRKRTILPVLLLSIKNQKLLIFQISLQIYQVILIYGLFRNISSYYNLWYIFSFVLDYLKSLKVRKSHLFS